MAAPSGITMKSQDIQTLKNEKPQNFSASKRRHWCQECKHSYNGSLRSHQRDCVQAVTVFKRDMEEIQRKIIDIRTDLITVYEKDPNPPKQKRTNGWTLVYGKWMKNTCLSCNLQRRTRQNPVTLTVS